jgi:predicted HD phosphohydrolase
VSRIASVDDLIAVLERGTTLDDGEGVDLLAHSLQCAANLEVDAPDDAELQVAGLLHDVGTILAPGHPKTHARTGAAAVRDLFGTRVAELVLRHDVAKRYLVTTDPDYRRKLSPQSIATLAVQGGELDTDELRDFDALPVRDACVTLRRADDAAKVSGRVVPGLDHWQPVLERVRAPGVTARAQRARAARSLT